MSTSAFPPHTPAVPMDTVAGAQGGIGERVRAVRWGGLHVALWPALAVLGLYAAFYVQLAARLVGFPYDLDQGEGYDAWSGWLIHLGQLPYTSNAVYPYYSSNYPPVWSYLVSIPMAWTGPGVGSARVVSALAGVLCAVAIGVAARRLSGSWWAAALAGGFFLASPYVFHTTPLARVNGTALLFGLVAMLLAEKVPGPGPQVPGDGAGTRPGWRLGTGDSRLGGSRRWTVLASLAMLAALFTKQTTLDALAAMLGFLLLVDRRRGLEALLMVGGGGLALLGALVAATRGAFWLNVVAGNANPFDFGQLAFYFASFSALHVAVLALAALELALQVRERRLSPWSIYFPAALLTALTVGKWGAGESYFLGAIAGACVLAGAGISRLLRAARELRPRASLGVAAGLGVALLLQTLLMAHRPVTDTFPALKDAGPQAAYLGRAPSMADRQAADRLADVIRSTPGPVLSEDPSFAVAAGKGVVANATHLRNLYQAGLWDPTALVNDVRARRYDVVVLNAELYPEPVLAAIGRSYFLVDTVRINGSTYHVFLPGTL